MGVGLVTAAVCVHVCMWYLPLIDVLTSGVTLRHLSVCVSVCVCVCECVCVSVSVGMYFLLQVCLRRPGNNNIKCMKAIFCVFSVFIYSHCVFAMCVCVFFASLFERTKYQAYVTFIFCVCVCVCVFLLLARLHKVGVP